MILGLAIRGLGVIDDAEIELGPGLTVVTGETGAGKTMVLTGLDLLLGGRTDNGLVRTGHAAAIAEGRFAPDGPERAALDSLIDEVGGAFDEDGSLLLARTISAEGRSRAHLGGRSVPAASLAAVGRTLVAVHGQDDQHRLLHGGQQRAALDRFGGPDLAAALEAYRATFTELVTVQASLRDVIDHARERARERDDLTDLLTLVANVDPQPGEEDALRAESDRLSHVDELLQAAVLARDAIIADGIDDGGASPSAHRALAALSRAADRDSVLAATRDRLTRAQEELDDIALDLARYVESLDADPGRLGYVEERRAALAGLRRRLERDAPEAQGWSDLATWRAGASARLAELDDDDALLVELRAREAVLLTQAGAAATALSSLRTAAAARLGDAVTTELAALAMPKARICVDVRRRGERGEVVLDIDGAPVSADRHGVDDVEFLLVAREGAPPRPLAKGASGGERSRIMLALEVVFAGMDPLPTFVFDEVDAGVGGKAAVEVGRRLARLARASQVIVVTHLPQVAAFATRHLVVRPGTAVTSSCVTEVQGEERARELARMLAGLEDSATAVAHAEELLAVAAEEAGAKSPAGRAGRGARSR